MEKMTEVKAVEGFRNYCVTKGGQVYSKAGKGKWLKEVDINGYKRAVLYSNNVGTNKYIHRLVAEAYIPNPDNKPEVNHIDGNKGNNDIGNLEWATSSENILHAYRTGLKEAFKIKITNGVDTFDSLTEAAEITGAATSNISNCIHGIRKSAGGYKWNIIEVEVK